MHCKHASQDLQGVITCFIFGHLTSVLERVLLIMRSFLLHRDAPFELHCMQVSTARGHLLPRSCKKNFNETRNAYLEAAIEFGTKAGRDLVKSQAPTVQSQTSSIIYILFGGKTLGPRNADTAHLVDHAGVPPCPACYAMMKPLPFCKPNRLHCCALRNSAR